MATNKGGAPFNNRNAVKTKPWRQALDRAIKRDTRGRLDKAAEAVLDAAAAGDLAAIKEIADRMAGRPAQAMQLEVTDSFAARMLAAEERLRLMSTGKTIEATVVNDDEEEPEWLQ